MVLENYIDVILSLGVSQIICSYIFKTSQNLISLILIKPFVLDDRVCILKYTKVKTYPKEEKIIKDSTLGDR